MVTEIDEVTCESAKGSSVWTRAVPRPRLPWSSFSMMRGGEFRPACGRGAWHFIRGDRSFAALRTSTYSSAYSVQQLLMNIKSQYTCSDFSKALLVSE